MPETTQFLLQLVGILEVLVGLLIISNPGVLKPFVKSMDQNALLLGFISLVAGLSIVLNHFLWDSLQTGIVSAVGVIATLKGVLYLFAPQKMKAKGEKMLTKNTTAWGVCALIFGLVCLGLGFELV